MVLKADNSLDNRDNCGKGDVDDEQIGELSSAVKLVLIGIMAALSIIITIRAAQNSARIKKLHQDGLEFNSC